MHLTRREALAACAGLLPALTDLCAVQPGAAPPRQHMGVVSYAYSIRRSADPGSHLDDPLAFLEFCQTRGAGGVQIDLGMRDETWAGDLRKALAKHQMYLEGIVRLPRDRDD